MEPSPLKIIYQKHNIIIHPYGSKHCLRRYLSLQIIVNYTQTLPKKVLGSIGHIFNVKVFLAQSDYGRIFCPRDAPNGLNGLT
jgi:hypothetical protein